jgi:hypothetical protein
VNKESTTSRCTKAAVRLALEDLFTEKGMQWQRREFVEACISRDIQLDGDLVQNKKKLLTWFDNNKHKKKQMEE